MHKDEKDTLEFPTQSVSDSEADTPGSPSKTQDLRNEGIVRSAYRLPVDASDPLAFSISGHTYQLMNISGRGAQFACAPEETFVPEQMLESVQLTVEDHPIQFSAEVVYTTLLEPERRVCGIYFQLSDENDQARLESYLERKRGQLFSGGE